MEKEFSKTKIIIATVVGIAFLSMVCLFMIAIIQKPVSGVQDVSRQNVIPAATIDQADKNDKESVESEDLIEFEDPGNDEIGKEVKQMDDLINDVLPSEYDENDLADEVIEEEVE